MGPATDVPPPCATLTLTDPEEIAGETAVICESELMTNDAAGVAPNCTDDAPPRLDPVSTTLVPPVAGPEEGAITETTGSPLQV